MKTDENWDIERTYTLMRGIYAQANALTTRLDERFAFFMFACADLSRCERKGQARLYPIAVAQVFAWFMSLADGLMVEAGGAVLATAMGEKYPADRCGYCGHNPCICTEESRPDNTLGRCSPQQRDWSVACWQNHLDSCYGNANREGGVARAIKRLFEEAAEVGLIIHQADGFNEALEDVREKIALEMTDVLAWLFAVASLLEVNLEQAVLRVYRQGCPVCHRAPCQCRSFEHRPRAGVLSHRFMPAEDIEVALVA